MQPITKKQPTSDDEDDLESLRLAALQSLKRPAVPRNNSTAPVQVAPKLCNPKTFNCSKGLNKRGRGFHGGGRSARNGAFNNRIRNSNLISVPTIEPEQSHDAPPDVNRAKKFSDKVAPKLILPQDRYCNTKPTTENKVNEASSKFDRYNDSDNSDSESESDDDKTSGAESPKKLERVNSLEALMQELENEIHGDAKPSEEAASKPKLKVKKSRKSKDVADAELPVIESPDELCPSEEVQHVADENECSNCSEDGKIEDEKVIEDLPVKVEKPVRRKSPSKPPVLPNLKRPPLENRVPRNPIITQPTPNLPYMNSNVPVATPLLPFQAMPYSNFNLPINHAVPFEPTVHYNYPNVPPIGCNDINSPPQQMFSPNRYERPISPLTIKTNILNTITAPLSPRSAAFVLQNREIIERRKKSPRRSYSRSPSPEFRRSVSPSFRYRRSNSRPSRSPSPTRQRLSPSRRVSPLRRASPNSRRASPNSRRASPNLRRLSPSSQPSSRRASPNTNRYRVSPPKRPSPSGRSSPKWSRRSPPRSNVRNRLGAQLAAQSHKSEGTALDNETERKKRKRSRSISLSLSPSPERFSLTNSPRSIEQEPGNQMDPVLEARRRKFEVKGSVPTAGIIRLKPRSSDEEDGGISNENGEDQTSEYQMDVNEDEDLNEDELLGGEDTYIDFNVRVDDLFSDEESDNENEGRFKSDRQQTARGVTVMPFTQLLNGSSNAAKEEGPLKDKRSCNRERRERSRHERADRTRSDRGALSKNMPERNKYKDDRDRDKSRNRPTNRPRSRSPLRTRDLVVSANSEDKHRSENSDKNGGSLSSAKSSVENVKKESEVPEKRPLKSLLSLKVDIKPERRKPPIVSPIENKKIEIKIRNPSKYEVESRTHDSSSKGKAEEVIKEKKSSSRKVEVASDPVIDEVEEGEFDEPDPEVIVDNEEDEDEDIINKNEGAGDLRAQLSRKRAERQNKLPKVEGVPSRLLQNALQGAVFKKSKKTKSKKKDKEAAPVDGKLPIHLRLGIPGDLDMFSDAKPHKKTSRKRSKNRGSFDQV